MTYPLTLILGAGASYPYGFPLGKELVDQIILRSSKPFKGLTSTKYEDEVRLIQIYQREFIDALRNSRPSSIDQFISDHRDINHYSRLGTLNMAFFLNEFYLSFKQFANLVSSYTDAAERISDDWYHYLVNRLFETNDDILSFFGKKVLVLNVINLDSP